MIATLPVQDSARSWNRLGIVGFVCSLLGIVTLGLLSPLAFLLSAIALRKRPRGFAWAGTTLGLAGSVLLVAVGTMGYLFAVLAGETFAAVLVAGASQIAPLSAAADAIDRYMSAYGVLPAVAEGEALTAPFKDAWGQALRYSVDGKVYHLTSMGPDHMLNTADDIRFRGDGKLRRCIAAGPDGRFDTADDVISGPIPAISPPVRK